MKKSQIYGQIFIYILTIVLVSFVIVYGYDAIKKLQSNAQQVFCIKFKNDLKNSVEAVSSDFGRVKKETLDMCHFYTKICFAETFEKFDKANPQGNVPVDPIIKESIKSGTNYNAFLGDTITKESFYAGNISVALDVLCITASNGKLNLRLEGKGNHAVLSQWS